MLRRLIIAWGALAMSAVLSYPLITGLAFNGFGLNRRENVSPGVWVVGLIAVGICLLTGGVALGITALRPRDARGVSYILGAMLLRMSVPLLALAMLSQKLDELGLVKFSLQLVPYYLIMLAIETLLSLWIGSATDADTATASGKELSHGR
ncbi:MAG: hypothetical protein SFX18_17185 [Pirellulales bacterium]|nr:hypothetical protein [Pirellulales bacterium]